MIDSVTGLSARPRHDAEDDQVTAGAVPTTTLITEQQVLIGSAAALAGPRIQRHRFLAAFRAHFVRTKDSDALVKPRRYPKHYDFIESAAMSRMMDRL
ncbi:hypothetical protein EV589_2622 [Mycobacterium sp. BK558]|nr:hypothetical protein EV589_2622 [Mycobacterium sp. BK558]